MLYPEVYSHMGIDRPRGILLYGRSSRLCTRPVLTFSRATWMRQDDPSQSAGWKYIRPVVHSAAGPGSRVFRVCR